MAFLDCNCFRATSGLSVKFTQCFRKSLLTAVPRRLSLASRHVSTVSSIASHTSPTSRKYPLYPVNPLELCRRPQANQSLALLDGRKLGYADWGDPNGTPLFYFHGTPGARLEACEWHLVAEKHKARIIATDRPGFGLSSFQADRQLLDFPEDIMRLADHLSIRQFRVFGGSGGGPYTLAAAKAMPADRLLGAGVVAGAAPFHFSMKGKMLIQRIVWNLYATFPSIMPWMFEAAIGKATRDPDQTKVKKQLEKALRKLHKLDDQMYNEIPQSLDLLVQVLCEALKGSVAGHVEDAKIMSRPWGFDLKDLDGRKVRFWTGSEDNLVPPKMGWDMSKEIEGSRMRVMPGSTHITIVARNGEEILKELLELGA